MSVTMIRKLFSMSMGRNGHVLKFIGLRRTTKPWLVRILQFPVPARRHASFALTTVMIWRTEKRFQCLLRMEHTKNAKILLNWTWMLYWTNVKTTPLHAQLVPKRVMCVIQCDVEGNQELQQHLVMVDSSQRHRHQRQNRTNASRSSGTDSRADGGNHSGTNARTDSRSSGTDARADGSNYSGTNARIDSSLQWS
jgi:hypothetical protein